MSPAELAQQTGLPTDTLESTLRELEIAGIPLERHPQFGYRATSLPDFLWADELHARLSLAPTRLSPLPWRPLFLQETDSTNDIALQAARRGESEGLCVSANFQRSGRGRHGRVWQSPRAAGLYTSLLLRTGWPLSSITRLTLLSGLAVAETVESLCRIHVRLKWPNDLIVEGKKLGGILVEAIARGSFLEAAILGIGLNVNQEREDFSSDLQESATSLRLITGQPLRRVELLTHLLLRVESLLQDSPESIHEKWSERCLNLGQSLTVVTPTGRLHGQALGLDPDGCLLLRLDSGKLERISVGDVTPSAPTC